MNQQYATLSPGTKYSKLIFYIFTVTFEDDRCYGPFYPTSRESFEVTHTTDQLSFLCRDFSFSGWDDGASLEREVCVKVKEFILDCSQTLEYRAGGNRNTPVRVS